MLDPSGCFYFTVPRIAVRVLVGSEQKIARLVANTIANKAYFKPMQKLFTLKRCARLRAIDYRRKVAKLIRSSPLSAFKDT